MAQIYVHILSFLHITTEICPYIKIIPVLCVFSPEFNQNEQFFIITSEKLNLAAMLHPVRFRKREWAELRFVDKPRERWRVG